MLPQAPSAHAMSVTRAELRASLPFPSQIRFRCEQLKQSNRQPPTNEFSALPSEIREEFSKVTIWENVSRKEEAAIV